MDPAGRATLSYELETFLDAGTAPIYFGFGSMHVPQDLGQVTIQTARVLGRRAIVSRGWDDLSLLNSTAHPSATATADSLTNAVERTLRPQVAVRAASVAAAVRRDGAQVAAQLLFRHL